jgi:hypothetical protein
VQPNNKLNC